MILALALACAPDDYDSGKLPTADDTGTPSGTDDTGTTATGTANDTLVGSWLSEGGDVSELLAGPPFNVVSISASFGADGSYEVVSTDAEGASGTLTGTYAVDLATNPAGIVLSQATPYTATAEGIFQIVGDTLTYEVVQTEPDYGYAPPTPESGFGTTSGNGIEAGINVQTYVRR